MRETTTPVVQSYTIAPQSRFTIHLNEVPGCANHHISTRLVSTNGVDIAAERSMYFNFYGIPGGHDSIGVPAPARPGSCPRATPATRTTPARSSTPTCCSRTPATRRRRSPSRSSARARRP